MNAVEIEQAVSDLVEAPFDRESFAFSFLEAFGNKATTIKKLKKDRTKKGSSNHSDCEGGVLQRNNIHLLVCDEGKVGESLKALVDSPETAKRKCKYALATDGKSIEAESLIEGETLACEYEKLADHFGFFLPLAGITTVKEIRNNAFDIKATSRLNRLYVELLRARQKRGNRDALIGSIRARLSGLTKRCLRESFDSQIVVLPARIESVPIKRCAQPCD